MEHSETSPKREICSNSGLPQESRKTQVNNLTSHLQELEKEQHTKPKVGGRKEIIKISAEINGIRV